MTVTCKCKHCVVVFVMFFAVSSSVISEIACESVLARSTSSHSDFTQVFPTVTPTPTSKPIERLQSSSPITYKTPEVPYIVTPTISLSTLANEDGVYEKTTGKEVFWSAVEAIGSTAAVVLALFLALNERCKERKRHEEQKAAIRTLLRLEIESNLKELEPLFEWARSIQSIPDRATKHNRLLECPKELPTIHRGIKDDLASQLTLFPKSVKAREIIEITDFYQSLQGVVDHQTRVLTSFKLVGENTDICEYFVGKEEREALVSNTVKLILPVHTLGKALASSLADPYKQI